jgi:hypothetical protein
MLLKIPLPRKVAPPRVDWDAWPAALLAALPALLASLLFASRLAGVVHLDGPTFGLVGLAFIAGCLLAASVARRLGWPGHLAWATTATALGLVVPILVIHLTLAERAFRDPTPIVLAPAVITLALLLVALAITVVLALLRRASQSLLSPALLPAPIWLLPLAGRPAEPLVWAALALTFAVVAAAWFATWLLRGWRFPLPSLLAVAAIWAAALSLEPVALPSTPATSLLAATHVAIAVVACLLPLLLPAALDWWWGRQLARRRAAGQPKPDMGQ